MAKIGKRATAARKAVDGKENLAIAEAVALVKANATAKFDENSPTLAMNLGVDPRHADQMVRGVVNLPNGTGKTVRSPSSRAGRRPTRPRPPEPTSSGPRT